MALTNAEKQAVHRTKKENAFEEIALSNAQLSIENSELRKQIEIAKNELDVLEKAHAKKISLLEKKLLIALEKIAKNV